MVLMLNSVKLLITQIEGPLRPWELSLPSRYLGYMKYNPYRQLIHQVSANTLGGASLTPYTQLFALECEILKLEMCSLLPKHL